MNEHKNGSETYIKKLIKEGENQHLDFKFEISDSRKIARTLVAFSNSDGGTLLIGVKDNGKIAGVRSEEEFFMVQAAANMYCRPEVYFESKRWTIEGKTILEIIIPKGKDSPYYAQVEPGRWLSYLRVKDENILATSVHLKVWKNKTHKNGLLIEYSDRVKKLMDYLETNPYITVTRFCRLVFLPRDAAENILADLVYLGIIEILFEGRRFIFKLKRKDPSPMQ
jgi:predicted HTH transcriptional regulator